MIKSCNPFTHELSHFIPKHWEPSCSVYLDTLTIIRASMHHIRGINPYAAGGYFGQYNIMQKTFKVTESLAHGYSSESTQREVSNEYRHDSVQIEFPKS